MDLVKALIVLLLVGSFAIAPLVAGHTGSGPPTPVDWRIEAEHFSGLKLCDPEWEGRHVRPVAEAGASNGEVLERPAGYCRVSYGPAQFEDSWRLRNARLRFADLPSDMPADTEIFVDLGLHDPPVWSTISRLVARAPWSSGEYTVIHQTGGVGQPVDASGDIYLDYYAWSWDLFDFVSLAGSTLYVDYLQFGCSNAHPGGTIIGFDGFGPDRDLFWQGASYPFTADVVDPEGDPLVGSTFYFNGVHQSGAGITQHHSFPNEGAATVRAWNRDDPTARCADAQAISSYSRTRTGTVHAPDWDAELLRPTPAKHCIAGLEQPTHGLPPVLSGRCRFAASVDTLGMPASLVGKAVWRIDGRPVASDTTAPYEATVDVTLAALPGPARVDVCFEAVNDIHAALMCSEPLSVILV